jgi:hypothetical protein
MKSTLRTRLSTAALALAALGGAFAALPAAAQYYPGQARVAIAPQIAIERFVLRGFGSFEPGSEVRFRMLGTPGGRATLTIPASGATYAMTETRPGVYEAEYRLRWRDNPGSLARATATLENFGQRTSARVDIVRDSAGWDHGPRRDDRAPVVTGLTPSHGDRVGDRRDTRIAARLADEGSGIDPRSVTLRVDGRDVTRRARVDNDEVSYREDLRPGRHVAEVVVRDRAGNTTRRAWSFDVVDRDRYGAWGPGVHFSVHTGR